MIRQKIQIIAWLCAWILSLQAADAFTTVSPTMGTERGSGFELRESTGEKSVYTQLNFLKMESAPQSKAPMVPFRFPSTTFFNPEGEILQPTPKEYTIRDHKYGLTILVYPFFIFW